LYYFLKFTNYQNWSYAERNEDLGNEVKAKKSRWKRN
jgi:hypothetical protein